MRPLQADEPQGQLRRVTADVRALALRSQHPGRATLLELAERLGRSRPSELATADLAAQYAPDVVLPSPGPPWLPSVASGLELLRDLLIFVPIAYTWWKISGALTAYNSYTGDAPFLLAWQQGFGQNSEPLSTSASVIAAIVTLIIVLTLSATMIRELPDILMATRRATLAKYLRELNTLSRESVVREAVDVSMADLRELGGKITESSQALRETLRKSSTDIMSAVTTGPGSRLDEMFKKWTAAATELTTLGNRLQGTQETVEKLAIAQRELGAMATQIGTTTGQLISALATERNLSRQEAHAHHALAAEVAQSTAALSASLSELHSRTEDLNQMINRMAYVVNRLEPR